MNTTSSQGDRYTVLVIEDNRFTRMQLCSLLEADGYHVASAENGEAGLALYHRLHPDLILLDAMMPEMDGFTCCTQLRQLVGDNLPIVMITCLEDQESVDCAFRVGTTDYITKPINWAVLRQRVWHQIQRSHLYTQVQQLNAELEKKVTERTAQLQQALNFEATLKRITDRVRDSLDEQQILQAAVKELALALEIDYCGTALSDLKHATSKIFQEYSTLPHLNHSQIVRMVDFPGIYAQLLQGQHFQFCKLPTSQNYLIPDRIAALACPIFDNEGALGELWLFKPMHGTFDEIEVRLVKQVANQCAIAIRQSRLYQAAQTQIEELARLNTLKDDFLNTVSHELRTPVANMKMAIQMLELSLEKAHVTLVDPLQSETQTLSTNKAFRYFQILNDECNREMDLINDLLDLQRLGAGAQPLALMPIRLQDWLPHWVEAFEHRAHQQQQFLSLEIDPDLPVLISDSVSISRIISELLNNACKYTPEGGKISVAAQSLSDVIHLRISNSGIEIPAQELPRVFDRFYRIPNGNSWRFSGTGLGLALVRELVNHLGGSVRAESGSGQTCFEVILPLSRTATW